MRQHYLLAAAVVFAAACSDDSTGPNTSITAEMRADVAAATGEAIATDVEAMSRTEASGNATLFAFAGDPSANCTISAGSFICIDTFGPLSGEATLTFRDAGGSAQLAYDAATTASVEIETEVNADIDRPNVDIEFTRMADLTVTGMAGAEASRTWNGTASLDVSSSLFAGARGYDLQASTTFTNVVVATSGTEPRWPTSGSATTTVNFTVTGGPDDGKTGSLTATVQFNGTAQVPLTVGGASYTLNLATHVVSN